MSTSAACSDVPRRCMGSRAPPPTNPPPPPTPTSTRRCRARGPRRGACPAAAAPRAASAVLPPTGPRRRSAPRSKNTLEFALAPLSANLLRFGKAIYITGFLYIEK